MKNSKVLKLKLSTNLMENKNVGYLLLGVSILVAIIICLLALVWFKDNGGMKCTSIRFSLWDSWKIFKFDELGRIALFRTKENVGVLRQ